ncbi:MAG: PIG-L family deacetylase [Deltaproteobacteria bacterium]|nr:PIG-L family deacetylase [Deltaproteobacteria bacterium]
MRERILVFGAHPDDAEIGVGGTIAAYAQRGHRVVMVNLRVPGGNDDSFHHEKQRRQIEGQQAASLLGAELINFGLGRDGIQPDARLVSAFDQVIAEVRPTAIYTHWLGDSHPEHVALTRAVLASTRRNGCSLYMYEATIPGGISAEAFRAQKFVDISDTIESKMGSLSCYETQLEKYGQGWLEAIRGRAAHRGFQIGCRYAEAFEVIKEIAPITDLRGA